MWYWIAAAALLIICMACYIACRNALKGISARVPSQVLATEADVRNMARYAYIGQLQDGVRWMSEQPMEELTVNSRDGWKLYGKLLHAKVPRGVILAFHGFHSFAEKDFGCIAPYLYDAGYSILFVDQRAHEKSEGDVITYGVKERLDCLEWAETVNAKSQGKLPLYLYGQSMGAATIMMASGLVLPDTVKGIIADSGFTSPAAIMRYTMREKHHLPAFILMPFMGLAARLTKGYGIWDASTVKALQKNRIPLLLFHGRKDAVVPFSMSEQNDRAAVAEHSFCKMDGAAHCTCFFHDRKQYIDTMLAFLNAHR